MSDRKLLLIGGGGHCLSVLDSLLGQSTYAEIGIIDIRKSKGDLILGVPVVGRDEDLESLHQNGYQYAFVTVGSLGDPSLRVELHRKISEIGYKIPTIIDSSAMVSINTTIGNGVFVGKGSIVNAGSHVGMGAIINSGAIVEHECKVGAFAHIAPGAVLGGNVTIGDYTHVGVNAAVKQGVHVGPNSIIGMGSVLLHDIGHDIMAYGNPCREVSKP